MNISRRDLALGAASLLLLATALVRLAVPDRSRIRPLSIEGVSVPSLPIGQGESVKKAADWTPPADVYLVGWSHYIGAKTPGAVLTLVVPGSPSTGETVVLRALGGSDEIKPQFVAAGTGYRINKGQRLRAALDVTNTGPPGETHGAIVLLYFVPVQGN